MDHETALELARDWQEMVDEGNADKAADIERRLLAAGYEPMNLLNGENH